MTGKTCGLFLLFVASVEVHAQDRIKRMFDVRSPMRDGVELSSDIWLPDGEGKYPLILMRTGSTH